MTKFTNLKHSIIGCNAITGRINFKLNQLQAAKSKKVKLPFWWTFALYQTKVRRSGRLYQAKAPIRHGTRLAHARAMPDQGLYTGVGAGAGAGKGAGAESGAEKQ